jgi:hypothetical protein
MHWMKASDHVDSSAGIAQSRATRDSAQRYFSRHAHGAAALVAEVLDRLADFSKLKAAGVLSRWALFGRALLCSVVVGNVVGICGNIAASVFAAKAFHF